MPLSRTRQILMRGIRLRCPRCGEEPLFTGLFSMHEQCDQCMFVYEQEPGFFVGAIYINYAATAVSAMAGFLVLGAYAEITLSGIKGRYAGEDANQVEIVGLYWHFVDLVWILVFTFVYLL